jgi:hypothetical protein
VEVEAEAPAVGDGVGDAEGVLKPLTVEVGEGGSAPLAVAEGEGSGVKLLLSELLPELGALPPPVIDAVGDEVAVLEPLTVPLWLSLPVEALTPGVRDTVGLPETVLQGVPEPLPAADTEANGAPESVLVALMDAQDEAGGAGVAVSPLGAAAEAAALALRLTVVLGVLEGVSVTELVPKWLPVTLGEAPGVCGGVHDAEMVLLGVASDEGVGVTLCEGVPTPEGVAVPEGLSVGVCVAVAVLLLLPVLLTDSPALSVGLAELVAVPLGLWEGVPEPEALGDLVGVGELLHENRGATSVTATRPGVPAALRPPQPATPAATAMGAPYVATLALTKEEPPPPPPVPDPPPPP